MSLCAIAKHRFKVDALDHPALPVFVVFEATRTLVVHRQPATIDVNQLVSFASGDCYRDTGAEGTPESLARIAEDWRARARLIHPGKEKDELLEKARQFESQIGVNRLLTPLHQEPET